MKHTLAKYLLELSIMDYNLVHIPPSEISAACLCMSKTLLDDEDEDGWDETLEFYSTYTEAYLQPIMNRLAYMVQKTNSSKQQVGCYAAIIHIIHCARMRLGRTEKEVTFTSHIILGPIQAHSIYECRKLSFLSSAVLRTSLDFLYQL